MRAMTSAIDFPALVIGLMSGTSADGVDAALIRTDGQQAVQPIANAHIPYDDTLRQQILDLMKGRGDSDEIAQALTQVHFQAIEKLIADNQLWREEVKLIGFHGQTTLHQPEKGITVQIGNPQWLASKTGIPVVFDFRSNDMKHDGQGAPLVPLYHAALAGNLPKPVMIVNIGGVANYTWLGEHGEIVAADCGPGNALLDDWMSQYTGTRYDYHGAYGKRGIVHEGIVKQFLRDSFFVQNRARSLDRNHFRTRDYFWAQPDDRRMNRPDPPPDIMERRKNPLPVLSVDDGAATLSGITAAAIGWSVREMPETTKQLLVTGGGRHNPTLMRMIGDRAGIDTLPVESVGWNGDMLEAEAFAYLAVRSVRGLPLSLPSTTGVSEPVTGGVLYTP